MQIQRRKLRAPSEGKPISETTRLKELWLEMSEVERERWTRLFNSSTPNSKIRAQLRTELGIVLENDHKLRRFREWLIEQAEWDKAAEQLAAEEARLRALGYSGEKLRRRLLELMKGRALVRRNFKLGAEAVRLDLQAEKVALDGRRVALLERKAKAYDRAQAALEESKNSEGGLTPETLRKIEQELNLF